MKNGNENMNTTVENHLAERPVDREETLIGSGWMLRRNWIKLIKI